MMLSAAIQTLLWSSTVGDDDETADNYTASAELCERVSNELAGFTASLPEGFDIPSDYVPYVAPACEVFGPITQFAHHFILTANGHGAGFWDGDWTSGEMLTELCEGHHIEVYLGDDGIVYPA